MKESKIHHWWPTSIQETYWADENGSVSWVTPEGHSASKKNYDRIGMKRHGHTLSLGSPWRTNFEGHFEEADNNVHRVIRGLQNIEPPSPTMRFAFRILAQLVKGEFSAKDMCRYTHMPCKLHRQTLLLINSLLIRSPAKRNRFEHFAKQFDPSSPPCEQVGKGNMRIVMSAANELYETGSLENQFFVLIRSPNGEFIYGDGLFDRLTDDLFRGVAVMNGKLTQRTISGKALVPLTPDLCVYFSTPELGRLKYNCASLQATKWMVQSINELVQIHSHQKIFYRGQKPKLVDGYKMNDHAYIDDAADPLIALLDDIARPER